MAGPWRRWHFSVLEAVIPRSEEKETSERTRHIMKLFSFPFLTRRWLCAALLVNLCLAGQLQASRLSGSQFLGPQVVLDQAEADASVLIQKAALSDPVAFSAVLRQAYGSRLTPEREFELTEQAIEGTLPFPARILFVPAESLPSDAAYAKDNGGVILLSSELRGRRSVLAKLVVHEWGHHLDALLGPGDSAVEEGEVFLQGISQGGPLAEGALARLSTPGLGHATIPFEGRVIAIECGFWDFISKPFKAIANVAKAVVKTAVNTVKNVASFAVNTAKSIGNTIVAGAQSVGSGIMRISGNSAAADRLQAAAKNSINRAGKALKGVGNNILDQAASAGKLINKAKAELDKQIPGLGTIAGLAISLTPAGPYVAAATGAADMIGAAREGNWKKFGEAAGFTALDVAGSAIGRVAGGYKAARAGGGCRPRSRESGETAKIGQGWESGQIEGSRNKGTR